jgi:superfamily I DNA and/or RNA helicase
VPESLIPMRLVSAGRTAAVVLVGDPRQLGPVVHSAVGRCRLTVEKYVLKAPLVSA